MEFKTFLTESEENTDVQSTLRKIPESHRKLVAGYQFKFQPGNTLKHDKESIGEVDEAKKTIIVCAPWHYGRQMTVLHEIGHLVWKYFVSNEEKKTWKELCKKTKMDKKNRQNAEETFCMSYASTYSKHPLTTYCKPAWEKFIKSIDSDKSNK
jgi:hypothetical protein